MQPAPVSASQPAGQAAAELAADIGHRRPAERAGLLEAKVVDLQPGDLAVPPAADDRLGDLVRVDGDPRPGVLGPGAQLHREVGHKHQLVDQAARRLRNPRVQQRGRGDDQDGAGLGFAGGSWRQQQAEVAVGDPAGLQGLAEGVGA
jgi:hypothetical protein